MQTVQMVVTPQIAAEFLTHNTNNRKPKPGKIRAYAKTMRDGKWQLNPDGISFYESGVMRDGQNRCHAIIEANTPVEMTVTFGVPNDSIICDMATSRSMLDILTMAGVPVSVRQKAVAAMTNILFDACGKNGGSNALDAAYGVDFCKDEAEYISDVAHLADRGEKSLPKRGPVMAAVYVAYRFGVDKDVLDRFCSVVGSGFYSSEGETAAVVIRNRMLNPGMKWNQADRRRLFRETLRAISDFERGIPRKNKYNNVTSVPYFDAVKEKVLAKYL